jgi:hypothetical protein
MSENNIDKMMKSILENATEEVPAHVWEGVSAGLDKAAAKKKVAYIWWRRAVAGVAAAAVAVFGLMLGNENSQTPPENVLMADAVIPVCPDVDNVPSSVSDAQRDVVAQEAVLQQPAQVAMPVPPKRLKASEASDRPKPMELSEPAVQPEPVASSSPVVEETAKINDIVDWGEDEEEKKRIKASLVLSGVTGAGAQGSQRVNLMKRPSLVISPVKTGIKETSTNTIFGLPVSVGAGVKFELSKRLSLGAGVNYSQLNRTFYGTYTKVEEGMDVVSTSSDIRNTQHYLGIPVNAYFNIMDSKRLNLYAYAGGTVEKCVSDKYQVLSTGITHTEKASGVQLSTNVGIGLEFMLGNHLGLYADPSLRYYFDNDQPKSIRTSQPLMLGLEMGLRIRL